MAAVERRARVFALTWVGIEATRSKLARVRAAAVDGVVAALSEEARVVNQVALPLTPIDTGLLRSTAMVHPAAIFHDRIEAAVTSGGPDAPYARWVHFRLDLFHVPPTSAMYLTRAVNLRVRGMAARIAAVVSVKMARIA